MVDRLRGQALVGGMDTAEEARVKVGQAESRSLVFLMLLWSSTTPPGAFPSVTITLSHSSPFRFAMPAGYSAISTSPSTAHLIPSLSTPFLSLPESLYGRTSGTSTTPPPAGQPPPLAPADQQSPGNLVCPAAMKTLSFRGCGLQCHGQRLSRSGEATLLTLSVIYWP